MPPCFSFSRNPTSPDQGRVQGQGHQAEEDLGHQLANHPLPEHSSLGSLEVQEGSLQQKRKKWLKHQYQEHRRRGLNQNLSQG